MCFSWFCILLTFEGNGLSTSTTRSFRNARKAGTSKAEVIVIVNIPSCGLTFLRWCLPFPRWLSFIIATVNLPPVPSLSLYIIYVTEWVQDWSPARYPVPRRSITRWCGEGLQLLQSTVLRCLSLFSLVNVVANLGFHSSMLCGTLDFIRMTARTQLSSLIMSCPFYRQLLRRTAVVEENVSGSHSAQRSLCNPGCLTPGLTLP